jgi:hypothetical protein
MTRPLPSFFFTLVPAVLFREIKEREREREREKEREREREREKSTVGTTEKVAVIRGEQAGRSRVKVLEAREGLNRLVDVPQVPHCSFFKHVRAYTHRRGKSRK